MNTLFPVIYTIYSFSSTAVVLIFLLHVMSQIFEKRTCVNLFSYYLLPAGLFILLYQGPRLFRSGERMPYFYLFICFILISVLWTLFFLKGEVKAKLPYLFYFYAAYKCTVFMLSWLYSSEALFSPLVFHLMSMVASVFELVILYLFTRVYIHHPFRFIYDFNLFETILLLFCPVSFFLLLQLADPSIYFPYQAFLSIAALCLLINLPIFYYLYVNVEEQYEARYDLQKALTETSSQLTRYRYTVWIDEQAKKERHELKNRYFYIQTLLHEGKMTQLEEYLKDIIGELSETSGGIHTGNVLIDHILNTRLETAHKINIKTYTEILIPEGTRINEDYFCTILLNLLDNAIEHSQNENSPDIQVYMSIQNRYLKCVIKNKVSENILQTNPQLSTTKKDKKNHGLGVKIIQSTAKKANALIDFSMESDYFIATVLMPLEEL